MSIEQPHSAVSEAASLLEAGQHQQALDLVETTLAPLWQQRDQSAIPLLALKAEILKTINQEQPGFPNLEDLPEDWLQTLVDATLDRVDHENVERSLSVLFDLFGLVSGRCGEQHSLTIQLLIAIADLCGLAGDHETRIDCLYRVIGGCDALGDVTEALHATLAFAQAQFEAGMGETAIQTYQKALHRAEILNDAGERSSVLREFGQLMAGLERPEDAEELMRQAVAEARIAQEPAVLGRAQIALAIYLQHDGKNDQAEPLLRQGLENVPPSHHDAEVANSHLDALKECRPCGCGGN